MRRLVDPYGYFVEHASAIGGQGGQVPSPDPRYCFHTPYEQVPAGPAFFRLTLVGARARVGEITIRVHAFRPSGASEVTLVAGGRLTLTEHSERDLTVDVRFRAVRDVRYALYGFFSEASDLLVDDVSIMLETIIHEEPGFKEDVATSVLADYAIGASASQSGALVLGREPVLDVPVSQDCTIRQLRSRQFAEFLPDDKIEGEGAAIRLWEEVVCRQALRVYGAAMPMTRGLLIGRPSTLLSDFCDQQGMLLKSIECKPEQVVAKLEEFGHVDFLLALLDITSLPDANQRFQTFAGLASRLLIGGLGAFGVRYAIDGQAGAASGVARNEMSQWILRLISMGFSAAPLAFAKPGELAQDEAGRAAIALILRRL